MHSIAKTIDKNLESFCVVWLSDEIDHEANSTSTAFQCDLRQIINHLRIFRNKNDCVQYIQVISNEHVILIISKLSDFSILENIHHWSQLAAVYILNNDKIFVEKFTAEYKKVIGVFNNPTELMQQIREDHTAREQTCEYRLASSSMTFCNHREQSSLLLNGSFMYFQLFVKLLLEVKPTDNAKQELLDVCEQFYANNTHVERILDKFNREYSPTDAILWYTSSSCFYRIINKALRLHDAEIMFLCYFLIQDLYHQLKQEHSKFVDKLNDSKSLYVYRGQLLSVDELSRMKQHIGELLSMNSFLSTSVDEAIALMFTSDINQCTDGVLPVLFRIRLDTTRNALPYANISHLSQFRDENEILIMAGAIFNIDSVVWDTTRKIWRIDLSLSNHDNHELQVVFDYCRQCHLSQDRSALVRLGILSRDLGQIDAAELFFKKQLQIDANDTWALSGLGSIAKEKGFDKLELDYHQRALQIDLDRLSNHPKIAVDYKNLGDCFRDRADYNNASKNYHKSQNLYLEFFNNRYDEIADLYKAMGLLYRSMKDYKQSFALQQKSLEIAQNNLPASHPYLADICTSVAWSYYDLGDLNQALEYFERAFTITDKSTPTGSYRMASNYHNLGHIHAKLNNIEKAIWNYEQAVLIEYQVVSPMNSLAAITHYELATVYERNKQYSSALQYYSRAIELFRNLTYREQSMRAKDGLHRMNTLLKLSSIC